MALNNNNVACNAVNVANVADDIYVDAIDLSNACREFYQTRKQTAEAVKQSFMFVIEEILPP